MSWLLKKFALTKGSSESSSSSSKSSSKKKDRTPQEIKLERNQRLRQELQKVTQEPERSLRYLAIARNCATGPVGYGGVIGGDTYLFEELCQTLTITQWIDAMYQDWSTPVLRGFCCHALAADAVQRNEESIKELFPILDKIIDDTELVDTQEYCMTSSEPLLGVFCDAFWKARQKLEDGTAASPMMVAKYIIQRKVDAATATAASSDSSSSSPSYTISDIAVLSKIFRWLYPIDAEAWPIVVSFLDLVDDRVRTQLQNELSERINNPRYYKKSRKECRKRIKTQFEAADPAETLPTLLPSLSLFPDDERWEILCSVFKKYEVFRYRCAMNQEVNNFLLRRQDGLDLVWKALGKAQKIPEFVEDLSFAPLDKIQSFSKAPDLVKSIDSFIRKQHPSQRAALIAQAYEHVPQSERDIIYVALMDYHNKLELSFRIWSRFLTYWPCPALLVALKERTNDISDKTLLDCIGKSGSYGGLPRFCYQILKQPDRLGEEEAVKTLVSKFGRDYALLEDILDYTDTEAKVCIPELLRRFKASSAGVDQLRICTMLRRFKNQAAIDEVKAALKKRLWDDIDGRDLEGKRALRALTEDTD